MVREWIGNYFRHKFIVFLNGGPLDEEGMEVEGDPDCDDPTSGMTVAQQLQVEDALKTLEMQVPIYITEEINSKLYSEVITRLHDTLFLRQRVKALREKFPDDKYLGLVELEKPIKIIITTPGGSVREAFGIYDAIQLLKDDGAVVETIGTGKVMSAGTLLISSGSKGYRKMTGNTTLMIHDISSGYFGTSPNIDNQYEELQRLREQYFEVFINNTKLTKKRLGKMLDKKVDQYYDAEESLKLGIIDEIV
jgi:ATP-dependent Clp endopeptidase proteolytic subunit ClpP